MTIDECYSSFFFSEYPDPEDSTDYTVNNEGRWQCPTCPRSYTVKDTLKAHLRYECFVEPEFKCRCGISSRHKQQLQKHWLAKHKEIWRWMCLSNNFTRICSFYQKLYTVSSTHFGGTGAPTDDPYNIYFIFYNLDNSSSDSCSWSPSRLVYRCQVSLGIFIFK